MMTPSTFTGTIHGRMIELEGDTSLPDGARVRVNLEEVAPRSTPAQNREAILESAGAWSDADAAEFNRWHSATCHTRAASHRDDFMDADAQR